MGRLTKINEDACQFCKGWDYCIEEDPCFLYEVYEKLGDYEDLEEQGRLIEQKYGYLMRSRDYDEDDGSYTIRQECSVCGMAFTPMFFKPAYCPSCGAKLVTKEEAEAKLKEPEE